MRCVSKGFKDARSDELLVYRRNENLILLDAAIMTQVEALVLAL